MKHDIFISYSSQERDNALQMKTVLEKTGYSCWMAPGSISPGSSYAEDIEDAISGCSVMVVMLSEKAQKSKWIAKEIDRAMSHDKTVIPFHTDRSELVKPFLFYLTDTQWIEAYNNLPDAYAALLAALEKIIGKPAPVDPGIYRERIPDFGFPGNTVSNRSLETDSYSVCKIYIGALGGSLAFSSDSVRSFADVRYLQFSGAVKDILTARLEKFLSVVLQADPGTVAVNYAGSRELARLIPSSEAYWAAYSVMDECKVSFQVNHFAPEKELLYDSFLFELNQDLNISFYSKGFYLHKPGEAPLPFCRLGIDEQAAVESATELVRICYPGKHIKVQPHFTPEFHDDCSGAYHLKFLVY